MGAMAFLAVAGAASTLQQGLVARAEGEAAGRQANYNAEVSRQNAAARKNKGDFDQKRHAQMSKSEKSRLKARQGAGGGQLGRGANLASEQQMSRELELEGLMMGHESRQAQSELARQAELSDINGELLRTRGRNAQKASVVQAGTSLMAAYGAGAFKGTGGKLKGLLKGGGGGGVNSRHFDPGRELD
jgi:hypothetical protein